MNPRNIGLVFSRELKSYFSSLTVYIVIVMFLLMTGYFFYNLLATFSVVSFQAQADPMLARATSTSCSASTSPAWRSS